MHHSESEIEEILKVMKIAKFSKVSIAYSGGNDSGGYDSAIATKEDTGETININYMYGQSFETWGDKRGLIFPLVSKRQVHENRIIDLMMTPVYVYYGSFAGSYYVNGEIIADVNNIEDPVQITDNYEEETWDDEEEENSSEEV